MSYEHLELAQQPSTDVIVQLFTLDASKQGLGQYFFTPGSLATQPLTYQAVSYQPFPIQITGLELTTQGAQPRPKLSISNIGGFVAGLVIAGNDLVGCTLTRIRTFARFLDTGSSPDPDAHWPEESWVVDRKSAHNKTTIEWELTTPLDNKQIKIPGRLCLKDSCWQRYRIYNGNAFDYSQATCPYTGIGFWTIQGVATSDPTQDQCGKRLSDCRNRFGTNATLPFGGFPGMTQI